MTTHTGHCEHTGSHTAGNTCHHMINDNTLDMVDIHTWIPMRHCTTNWCAHSWDQSSLQWHWETYWYTLSCEHLIHTESRTVATSPNTHTGLWTDWFRLAPPGWQCHTQLTTCTGHHSSWTYTVHCADAKSYAETVRQSTTHALLVTQHGINRHWSAPQNIVENDCPIATNTKIANKLWTAKAEWLSNYEVRRARVTRHETSIPQQQQKLCSTLLWPKKMISNHSVSENNDRKLTVETAKNDCQVMLNFRTLKT